MFNLFKSKETRLLEFIEKTAWHLTNTFEEPIRTRALARIFMDEGELEDNGKKLNPYSSFKMTTFRLFDEGKKPYATASMLLALMLEFERDESSAWSEAYGITKAMMPIYEQAGLA